MGNKKHVINSKPERQEWKNLKIEKIHFKPVMLVNNYMQHAHCLFYKYSLPIIIILNCCQKELVDQGDFKRLAYMTAIPITCSFLFCFIEEAKTYASGNCIKIVIKVKGVPLRGHKSAIFTFCPIQGCKSHKSSELKIRGVLRIIQR